jgi:hypothetical protein
MSSISKLIFSSLDCVICYFFCNQLINLKHHIIIQNCSQFHSYELIKKIKYQILGTSHFPQQSTLASI